MGKINVLYITQAPLGGDAFSLCNMIRSLSDKVNPVVLLPDKGEVYDLFASCGIRCIIHPFRCNIREKSSLNHYLRYIPHLVRDWYYNRICINYVCKNIENSGEGKIDLVHSNSSVFTIGVGLARKLGAKHVWHIREFQDLDFGIQPFCGWKRLKKMVWQADAVVAITAAVYRHWELDNANRSFWIWDAVRSEADKAYQKEKGYYFFFCAAMLTDAKGTDMAIRAFSLSGLAKEGYKLILAGKVTKDCRKCYDRLAHSLGVQGSVEFVGFCHEVKSWMERATAFLMCSKSEGLGRVTVESMFYGCPVIARKSGGTKELLKDGKTGLLFTDENGCAKAMQVAAKTDMQTMILAAQKYAVENFSEEKYGVHIINLYKEILKN